MSDPAEKKSRQQIIWKVDFVQPVTFNSRGWHFIDMGKEADIHQVDHIGPDATGINFYLSKDRAVYVPFANVLAVHMRMDALLETHRDVAGQQNLLDDVPRVLPVHGGMKALKGYKGKN